VRKGSNVEDERASDDWIAVAVEADLPVGKAIRSQVEGMDVFLYRAADRIFAMDNRCNHQQGPLHRGVVKADIPQPTVTCPVHGSMFWMTDGRVVRGPASHAQPVYDVRVTEGIVEVRLR
jgi:nitrite reductase/ring-hydroxylating ferredoxin subunit